MSSWQQAPMVRLLPSFLFGIVIGLNKHSWIIYAFLLALLFLCFYFVLRIFIHGKTAWSFRWLSGLTIHIALFAGAFLLATLNYELHFKNHFSSIPGSNKILAIVNEDPILKGKNLRFEVRIISVWNKFQWKSVEGKCLVYVRHDSTEIQAKYGDLIAINAWPVQIPPTPNPGQFDFRKWLENKNIFHQLFISSSEWKLISEHEGNPIVQSALDCRNRLLEVFYSAGLRGQEYAVISALILGYDDEISQETMQAFAASGALHILSVSGMHVGLIYGVLLLLLKFMDRIKYGKWIRAILIILFLWLYSLLTGFSPSVLRSAMMLTFIILGKTYNRASSMYNTLAASAITLFMIFSPNLICQAGFQLSYCAVIGIAFLYKPIYNWFLLKTWIGEQAWSILAVSLAAQLATLPVSLYYFHQFPNYFLVSNLVVIPLSTLAIFSGISLFVLTPFSWLLERAGCLVYYLVRSLNGSTEIFEHLPYSVSRDLMISGSEMILMYIFILFLSLFFLEKNKKYFFIATIVVIPYLVSRINFKWNSLRQNECIVNCIPGHSCLQFIQGKQDIIFMDTDLLKDFKKRKNNLDGYRIQMGLKDSNIKYYPVDSLYSTEFNFEKLKIFKRIIQFDNYRILFVDSGFQLPGNDGVFQVNSIIFTENVRLDMDSLLAAFPCNEIIADASNRSFSINRIKKYCEAKKIRFCEVTKQGAWILKL